MSIQPLLIGSLGLPELLIILFIIFLIVGGKKLPQLGAGLGEGIKNFKKGVKDDASDASEEPRGDSAN